MSEEYVIKNIQKAISNLGLKANYRIDISPSEIGIYINNYFYLFKSRNVFKGKDFHDSLSQSHISVLKFKEFDKEIKGVMKACRDLSLYQALAISTLDESLTAEEFALKTEMYIKEVGIFAPVSFKLRHDHRLTVKFNKHLEFTAFSDWVSHNNYTHDEVKQFLIEHNIKESDLSNLVLKLGELKKLLKLSGCKFIKDFYTRELNVINS